MQAEADEVIGWLFIEHDGPRRWAVLEPELKTAQGVFDRSEITGAKLDDRQPIRRAEIGRYIMMPDQAVEQPR